MHWKLIWSNEAAGQLCRFDNTIAGRIIEKLETVSEDPAHHFERLVGSDYYKLRVGDYRIVVSFFYGAHHIVIHKIGHRKNIYKGLS